MGKIVGGGVRVNRVHGRHAEPYPTKSSIPKNIKNTFKPIRKKGRQPDRKKKKWTKDLNRHFTERK